MHRLPVLFMLLPSIACTNRSPAASTARKANDDVNVIKDIAYYKGKNADEKKHKLDLYLPKNKKGFPMLMFVHGGAWRSGDKLFYGRLGNSFAGQRFGTAVISYRLAPGVTHPGHIEDVARAFAWLHNHAAEYGGDSKRIFVSGHSAGAHLVALLALNDKYLKSHHLARKDIAGVLAISGPYVIRGNIFDAFGNDAAGWKDASPLEHVVPGAPPFLIIYADGDFPGLPASARMLNAALKKDKDDSDLVEIAGKNHINIITSVGTEGDKTTEAMLRFLQRHMGKERK